MKIEVKDINKHLSLKGKLVVTGKYSLSVAKNFFEKYKQGYLKMINIMREKISESISNIKYSITPSEEIVQNTIGEKLSSLNTKRNELQKLIENMEEIEEYKIGLRNCYLKESQKELQNLDKKILNITNRGLGIYTLTKLAASKIIDNTKNRWNKHKEKVENQKKEKEITRIKNQLINNCEQLLKLKQEEKELLEKYPEINNSEPKSVEMIRKPSAEEKENIKKSGKLKKALISLTVAAGIAISSITISNISKDTDSNLDNDLPTDNPTKVEEIVINDDNKEEQKITLGNYLSVNEGSRIYENAELNGKQGIIGMNGYNSDTLFKVNAITYIDENGIEISFNLVQKDDKSKLQIEEQHKKYIENNKNLIVKNFHITPCDELGVPLSKNQNDIDLGGWTNTDKAGIQNIDNNKVFMNTYQSLGGKMI